ncbi:MAG: type 2 isopentenyl-diphosphate Delta-isomerase [Candidatus Bathyarchaeota archaeon]|nr:MAG: type 2 isopentenyl-diphosphate Delta-isomerase [Candidatus Bathyarchaeota archaeon]
MKDKTQSRKSEHIQISLQQDVRARHVTTGFEDVNFVHQALPQINYDEITLASNFLGHEFSAPILVGAMTGGTEEAMVINTSIAKAVEELGLGMGVGSQRAALEDPELASTYRIVRENAPNAFLIANIGAPQLVNGYGLNEVEESVRMIKADALAIHLNALQEAIQPEGETNYKGVLAKIRQLKKVLKVPIILKETGAGISSETATRLENIKVDALDVAGAGGTSWAAVEFYRAKKHRNLSRARLGECFWDWGIPTAVCVVEVSQSTNLKIIASGGIRSGLDVAKALSLGADLASFSTPILEPATKGSESVKQELKLIIEELKTAMFLVGARNVNSLKNTPLVLLGRTAEWLEKRGFKSGSYVRQ